MKTALLIPLLLAGCAAPLTAPKEAEIHVLGHECDQHGVNMLRIIVAGLGGGEAAIGEVQWSNKDVCGDPT